MSRCVFHTYPPSFDQTLNWSLLGKAGYGDKGGLGLVAAGPPAGRLFRILGLLARVLDCQEESPTVWCEGRPSQFGLDGRAGELEDVVARGWKTSSPEAPPSSPLGSTNAPLFLKVV